jgi:hypothetical protein
VLHVEYEYVGRPVLRNVGKYHSSWRNIPDDFQNHCAKLISPPLTAASSFNGRALAGANCSSGLQLFAACYGMHCRLRRLYVAASRSDVETAFSRCSTLWKAALYWNVSRGTAGYLRLKPASTWQRKKTVRES